MQKFPWGLLILENQQSITEWWADETQKMCVCERASVCENKDAREEAATLLHLKTGFYIFVLRYDVLTPNVIKRPDWHVMFENQK